MSSLSHKALQDLLAAWRKDQLKIVLTNGCFDLLHVGHLRYLRQARALGDRLVVAVNDDESTRRIKGPGRPILPVEERLELLLALDCVDAVIAFSEPTAEDVVRALRPEIYAKGGDYGSSGRVPPEAALAIELGGSAHYLSFTSGRSTSNLIQHIRGSKEQ